MRFLSWFQSARKSRPVRSTRPRRPAYRLGLEALEDRCLLSAAITEFAIPTATSLPYGITAGPDGNLWFAEYAPTHAKIGRITPSGSVTEFALPKVNSQPAGITAGQDGNIWFTESDRDNIGRITPSGVITEFAVPTALSDPWGITAGPDGNIWFTEGEGGKIGRITTSGTITEYAVPTANSDLEQITAGPDGNIWFTEVLGNKIGRITPSGTITEFALPVANSKPYGITAGPDGNLWFDEIGTGKIGRITPSGTITEFTVPTAGSGPLGITAGPDGNLWFTEENGDKIGRITPSGTITEFPVPTAGSFPWGIAVGPDGNIWFTEEQGDKIGQVSLAVVDGPSFVISGPTTDTAGMVASFTLTTVNANSTPDTGYSGTVQIGSSDPQAILPGNVTISGGTGTFNVTLETAGTQSVIAADVSNSGISGVDAGIAVTPAVANQLVFTQGPASGTAGQTLGTVQLTLKDAYGNVETGDNSDSVTLSVNSGPSTQMGGTLTATVQAGVASFSNLMLNTSGTYTLAALANGGTLGPVVSSSFAVASPVSVSLGSITYNSRTGLYSETVTLTNTTSGTLSGPMSLELTNLPSGVVLTDATGTTNGNPYYRFLASGKTLKKNTSTSITLTFGDPSQVSILFGTEVVVGL